MMAEHATIPNSRVMRSDKRSKDPKTEEKMIEEQKDRRVQALIAGNALKTIAENIAEHQFYHRNYYWPGCKQAFPHLTNLQHVDKFFPFAVGGPLFVDEVKPADNRDFKQKKEVMSKLGHRYLVVTHDMKLIEAYEALA